MALAGESATIATLGPPICLIRLAVPTGPHVAACPPMASAAPYLPPPVHERHRPELTPLHQLASAHWPRFLARADEAGGLPSFVRKEFEAYLDCGIAGKGSRLRKKYSWLGKVYWAENIVWSPGYFVSSVGVDEETIKRYVEHQGQQDSGQFQMKL